MFFKSLNKVEGDITVIPQTKEKYISLTKKINVNFVKDTNNEIEHINTSFTIRFLDSFRFMPASLDELGGNLEKSEMSHIKKTFPNNFELITRKGVFPYEYLDSIEKLSEKSLPNQSVFFNHMTNKNCSDADYKHAQNVWNTFHCVKT